MSQYIVDKDGKRTHIILTMEEYEQLIEVEISKEEAAELEKIRNEMIAGDYVEFDPNNYTG